MGFQIYFTKGVFGVAVYKGFYQNNELKFNFFKDLFYPWTNGPINVYVQPSDIPTITDMDNDGDLDILAFDVLGSQLTYYKNLRVEDGLPCDSIRMSLFSSCWGNFYQTYDRTVITGVLCKGATTTTSDKKTRHTGNCIVHFDIDGDGDLDMVGGNISFSDAQVLFNNGSDIINAQDTSYDKNGHVLNMPTWPSPFHLDIDNDGDKDLLFTSHNDNISSANWNSVAWYKNSGTDLNPNFVYQHDSLLTTDMIDVGQYSYPTFFDYNKDGKLDLFVGNEGYLDNATGVQKSKLAYYKNTTTGSNISFELVTRDFLNLSLFNFQGIFPAFGDITGDGIDDFVFGNAKGSIGVYKNFANSNTSTPNFIFMTDSLDGVNVTKYSTPCFYDFDQDGKTDLLIGNQIGKIALYRDTSSTNIKKLALSTISLGNLQAGSVYELFGYSAPTVCKMDNTGKDFLVIGSISGTLERYDSIANNFGTFNRIDSNYSYIQTQRRSTPAIADLDGDGKYEMVVGNKMGGLLYYKQVLDVPTYTHEYILTQNSVEFYPNPSDDKISILFKSTPNAKTATLKLFDFSGRLINTLHFSPNTQNSFNINYLQSGIYLANLIIDGQTITKKIIKK
jgi:hypothetical protein